MIARFRRRLAAEAGALAAVVRRRGRRPRRLAAEILPLLECCRFLERRAAAVLRSERAAGGAPLWLRGTVVERRARAVRHGADRRRPSNYGLMLAGVQTLHALTAGNAVIVKPAPGSRRGARALRGAARGRAACPPVRSRSPRRRRRPRTRLLAGGVDKLVFTGSSGAGRELLAAAARNSGAGDARAVRLGRVHRARRRRPRARRGGADVRAHAERGPHVRRAAPRHCARRQIAMRSSGVVGAAAARSAARVRPRSAALVPALVDGRAAQRRAAGQRPRDRRGASGRARCARGRDSAHGDLRRRGVRARVAALRRARRRGGRRAGEPNAVCARRHDLRLGA